MSSRANPFYENRVDKTVKAVWVENVSKTFRSSRSLRSRMVGMAMFMPEGKMRLFAPKYSVFGLEGWEKCFIRKHSSGADLFYFESLLDGGT